VQLLEEFEKKKKKNSCFILFVLLNKDGEKIVWVF